MQDPFAFLERSWSKTFCRHHLIGKFVRNVKKELIKHRYAKVVT